MRLCNQEYINRKSDNVYYTYILLSFAICIDYLLEQFNTTAVPLIYAEWRIIADYLDYPPHVVQKIDKSWSDSVKCCKELFTDWCDSNNGIQPCSWEVLVTVLKDKKFGEVGSLIEKKLMKLGISVYVPIIFITIPLF